MTTHRTSHRRHPMRRDCDRYQGRLCACARSGLVAAIDRKRYEQWAAEWQAVEPLWSKPLPT
ncbi:hypothetical protein ABZ752_13910 [Streptomyces roseifaciens]